MKERLKKLSLGLVPVATIMLSSTSAFASEGTGTGTAESISTSLQSIATDITSTIGTIAPVAMGIAGLFLAWKYGMRFFKSLTK